MIRPSVRSDQGRAVPDPPLVFVYLGKFPLYGKAAIEIAVANYSGQVVLISDNVVAIKGCLWMDAQNFRSPLASQLDQNFLLDREFRNGLWWKAYQRFFILLEYCRKFGLERCFHAELDNLILNLEGFSAQLDNHGRGVFVPQSADNVVVAALIYWNSLAALENLCKFLAEQGGAQNEMNVLAMYLNSGSEEIFSFATEQVWDLEGWPYSRHTVPAEFGIVDSAGLGSWFFGAGPDTTRCTIWNKCHPGSGSTKKWPINDIRVSIKGHSAPMVGLVGQQKLPLRTLHVSSKIHCILKRRLAIKLIIGANRLPFRVPIRWRAYCSRLAVVVAIVRRMRALSGNSLSQPWRVLSTFLIRYSNSRGLDIPQRARRDLAALAQCTENTMTMTQSVQPTESVRGSGSKPLRVLGPKEILGRNRVAIIVTEACTWESLAHTFGGDLENPALERIYRDDPDMLPLILAHSLNLESFIFIRASTSETYPQKSLEYNPRDIYLTFQKHPASLAKSQNILNSPILNFSWNFSSRIQIFRPNFVRGWFSSSSDLEEWWASNRRGERVIRPEDYYGARLIAEGKLNRKTKFLVEKVCD